MKHKQLFFGKVLAVVVIALTGCNDSGRSSGGGPTLQDNAPIVSDPHDQIWQSESFGLAAADEVSNGVYIATDYVFDDLGADTDGTPGGDFSYPAEGEPYKRNAADLVELRLMPVANQKSLLVGIRLNTLIDEAIPVTAVGIDDGSTVDLDTPWPFNAGVHARGVRYVLTITGEAATLTDLVDNESQQFPVVVNNNLEPELAYKENTFTVSLPLEALNLNSPPTGVWQLYAISGLWNDSAWSAPQDGAAAPYDVGFIEEDFVNWQQNRQAAVLASGDLIEASTIVDYRDFPNRAAHSLTGLQTRIYRSPISHLVGEGIAPWNYRVNENLDAPSGSNHYQGLYLPYLLWVPPQFKQMAPPYPVFTLLHGLTQTHLSVAPPFLNGTMTHPGLTIMPSGAGESSFYKAEGEIDLLAILADIKARYPIDEDRVYVSGLSMGGQGVYTFAVHHPDLFAAAIPVIGTGQAMFHRDAPIELLGEQRFTTDRFQNSNGRELMENVYNLPVRQINGAQDPIVNPSWPEQDAQRAIELGNDYQLSMFTNRGHEVVFEHLNVVFHQILRDCQTTSSPPGCAADEEAAPVVRDENPARVIYKVTPHQFFPEIGVHYDGAYWVSDLIVRSLETPGDSGLIDATSFGLAHKLKGEPVGIGRKFKHFAPTGDDYAYYGQRQVSSPMEFMPRMEIVLQNLSNVSIDIARAGLENAGDDVIIAVETDGESLIILTSVKRNSDVFLDNNFVMTTGKNGQAEIYVDAGNHTITLSY